MRAKLFMVTCALVAIGWAVPSKGAAHFLAARASNVTQTRPATLRSIRLRVERDRGLLVDAWVNGRGPFVFAIDTGAGMNLVTQQLVADAQLRTRTSDVTVIGGLSRTTRNANREAVINEIALGERGNVFRSKTAVVVPALASGVDGILDPTDVYAPSGYSIDLPNETIEAVPVSSTPRRETRSALEEGAVVPWVRLGGSGRPFVRLGDGRLALIDTGSGFGLAVNQKNAVIVGSRGSNQPNATSQDIGGGVINSRRVAPTTISIGELELRRVPTDILFGVADDAPLILGRDALSPFKITFDPQQRLIEFETSNRMRG